ncbi:unnamed protein product [Brachionus calyciflorus]|uniref:DWNN domain-containing protein n=1 Tax=Brachionus calyciflorus TaxID=104777 RepID=A0A813NEH1_9BILA|nr:unnamed protein product [Brachionus calyciflorus]
MSFIHYKLITNQNYEKIAFDGVSLSVGEIKKLVMEKKFRKHITATSSNSRKSDVDLEVTNADTNEVYKNDAEMIPKNSRVQINRVVKNIGPAISGGTITHTHKENENMMDMRFKNRIKTDLDLDDSILLGSTGSKTSDSQSGQNSPDASMLYDDIDSEPSLNINPLVTQDDFLDQKDPFNLVTKRIDIKIPIESNEVVKSPRTKLEQERPPDNFLCPFDDGQQKHLMVNAIIVPCCGYFICCEKCIRDKLSQNQSIECPHESCSHEITQTHRLTPYTPIRNKINDYLKTQSNNLNKPIDNIQTKFPINQNGEIKLQHSTNQPSPNKLVNTQTTTTIASPNQRPIIKIAVKFNQANQEVVKKVEPEPQPEPEPEKKEELTSPISSRSSSPCKISSDSESNSKVSQDGSVSPVSETQEGTNSNSRSSSPSSIASLKEEEKQVETINPENSINENKIIEDLNSQPIQPIYNQQFIPTPQPYYPYNMPPGQIYPPQMDPFFNQRFPRPNFPMYNQMRFPQPGPMPPAQNFYPGQVYPGQFIPDQFYARPQLGVPYQNYQRWNGNTNVQNRKRSRSRSKSRHDRYRRKKSYSRSRSRSPNRYHKRSRYRSRSRTRSRSRSAHRRDKRSNYRRRSSSRRRDRSKSRDRSRSRRRYDDKTKDQKVEIDKNQSPKPVNKENEMDHRDKTVHKLTNLMHKRANIEPSVGTNGPIVIVPNNQDKESQNESKDTKKNRIVFLFKANNVDTKNKTSGETSGKLENSIEKTVSSSPVKKSQVKRKVHLKKELASTSTSTTTTTTIQKKTVINQLDVKVDNESQKKILEEKKSEDLNGQEHDFLDISIDEKINF